jgi:hypothetical protein
MIGEVRHLSICNDEVCPAGGSADLDFEHWEDVSITYSIFHCAKDYVTKENLERKKQQQETQVPRDEVVTAHEEL